MAVLFTAISAGDVIRTTPTQSPRTSWSLRDLRGQASARFPSRVEEPGPTSATSDAGRPPEGLTESRTPTPTAYQAQSSSPASRRSSGRPPPILKKSRAGSTQEPKTARVMSPKVELHDVGNDQGPSNSSETVFSVSPSVAARSRLGVPRLPQQRSAGTTAQREAPASNLATPASGSRLQSTTSSIKGQGSSNPKPSKKTPSFAASTAATKRRPSATRRKSSQSSSSSASKNTSPRLAGQRNTSTQSPLSVPPELQSQSDDTENSSPQQTVRIGDQERELDNPTARPPRPTSPQSSKSAGSSSASSSRHDSPERRSAANDPEEKSADEEQVDQLEIAPKDFRSKFVDKSREGRSGPFRPVAPKATAVSAVPASYQSSGILSSGQRDSPAGPGKGKMKQTTFYDETIALKPPGPTSGLSNERTDTYSALPRTKSQLTLLLERDRRSEKEKKPKDKGRQQKN